MPDALTWLLDSSAFTPRAFCGPGWTDGLRWVHAGSDILIGLAYIAIPVILLFLVRRRGVPFTGLIWLFGAFILACGSTHLVESTMFQTPVYRLSAALKMVTAVVSWVTVVALAPAAPRIVRAVQTLTDRPHGVGLGADPGDAPGERARHFIVAVLAAVLVVLVRAALDPVLENRQAFTLSILAVVAVGWYGGLWPALLTLVLSLTSGVYLFVLPRYSLVVQEYHDQFAIGLFLFAGVGCAMLGEAQRRTRRQADRAYQNVLAKQADLEAEVGRRELVEADLRDARTRLDAALTAGAIATWVWDISADRVFADARLAEFFRVSAADAAGGPLASYVDAIHPDDRGWVSEMIGRAVGGADDGEFDGDYRLVSADPGGPVRWVSARGRVERDADGRPARMPGVVVDITDRKRAEERLAESEGRFRTMADALPQLAWTARPDGHIFWYNRRWYEYTGTTPAQMEGWNWQSVHDPAALPAVMERWQASVASGTPFDMVFPLRGADGVFRPFLTRAEPVRGPDGAVALWVGSNTDVSDQRRAEDAVRRAADRLTMAMDAGGLGDWEWDAATDGVTFSDRAADIFGVPPGPQPNRAAMWDVLHPDDRDRVRRRVEQALAWQSGFSNEYRVDRPDGTQVWVASTGRGLYADDGTVVGMAGVIQDVTDRRRQEEAVRESESRFRVLAEAVPQIVWVTRPDGFHEYYNPRWYDFTGLTEAESVGFGWSTPLHPDDKARAEARWKHSTDTGEPYEVEYRFRGADGAYRWFLAQARPLRDEAGAAVKWFGTCTDIDDRKRAEVALLERARLAALRADVGVNLGGDADIGTVLQRCAEALVRHLDAAFARVWLLDEAAGVLELRASAGMYTHLDGPHARVPVGRFKIGRIAESRQPHLTNDVRHDPEIGDPAWAAREGMEAFAGYPLLIGDRVLGVAALFAKRPLTAAVLADLGALVDGVSQYVERKRAEAAVRASEARFRDLANSMPQIVWSAPPDGRMDYYNERWYEYTGTDRSVSGDESWAHALHPDDLARTGEEWYRAVRSGRTLDMEFRLKDHRTGGFRWMLARGVPVRDAAGAVVRWYGTSTDIDDAKRTQAELARSLERFRLLTEAIPQIVWNADPAGQITYFNARWLEYTGVLVDGAADRGWLDAVHPGDAARVYESWHAAVAGVEDRFTQELRLRRAADGMYRWFLTVAVPLRRSGGDVDQWIGSMADIHDQKEQAATLEAMVGDRTRELTAEVAERRRAEEKVTATAAELTRSNGELEKFAYVASHDLQEPLRKIQAFGDRLATRHAAALGEQGKDYLDRMQSSAARMRQLINDLLAFSRVTSKTQPFARVDLNKVVADAVDDLHVRVQQTSGVVDVGPLPAIDADPTQVRQLVQNLIGNA